MRSLFIAAAIAALSFSPSASAQAFNCGNDNRAAGAVVGALVGGAAGGVIANNTRRDVFIGRRGFYGHRGFRGRRGRFVTRRGNQELGIVLGAIAGGLIGSEIAANNSRGCPTVIATPSQRFGDPFAGSSVHRTGQFSHVVQDGPIDLNAVKYGDPFGGRPIARTPVASQPPAPQSGGLNGGPSEFSNLPQGVFQPICETVFQTTELPDGSRERTPIEVCQYSEGGVWIPTN